jgi:hypothetical protein
MTLSDTLAADSGSSTDSPGAWLSTVAWKIDIQLVAAKSNASVLRNNFFTFVVLDTQPIVVRETIREP